MNNWSKSSLSRHMNIPASYLVLLDGGKVLLLRRFNTGFKDGLYSLVAGHVDEGETFTQALIREAKEEAGISIDPKDVKFRHLMQRKSSTDGSERTDVFFVVEKWAGKVTNCEPHKCDQLKWYPLDDLPDNTIEYIRFALNQIKAQCFFSEFGWESQVGRLD